MRGGGAVARPGGIDGGLLGVDDRSCCWGAADGITIGGGSGIGGGASGACACAFAAGGVGCGAALPPMSGGRPPGVGGRPPRLPMTGGDIWFRGIVMGRIPPEFSGGGAPVLRAGGFCIGAALSSGS
jgi:hypothetical protein